MAQRVHDVAERLSSREARTLLYLCGAPDPSLGAAGLGDAVRGDGALLRELVFSVKRFDLLRKVLRTDRLEVEETLRRGRLVPEYRVLMADLSDDIGEGDLRALIFLLSDILPKDILSNVKGFLDVVVELEKRGEVSSDRVELLKKCLRNIHRADLVKKLDRYQRKVSSARREPVLEQFHDVTPASSSVTPIFWNRKQELAKPQSKHTRGHITIQRTCHQEPLDKYRVNSHPRGACVIIDCVGSDGGLLAQTFRCLHFHVILHKLPSTSGCHAALAEVAKRDHHRGDAFACCIISRDSSTGLLAADACASGTSLNTVRHMFSPGNCPGLVGKPRLFFIQTYRVPEVHCGCTGHCASGDDFETDGPAVSYGGASLPTDADVFWSHCWTDERQLREPNHRSVYVSSLSAALLKGHKGKTNLLDAHVEVNRKIFEHNEKNPGDAYNISLRHTLRKALFLS
ncbi:CASP8 and FADD-like apoptosis regulator [Denticeps clupeoides]|uniref:CASP8 and FADD-like apoptosis regulator n=1 Tax=Denticeps clupeoides TaxID=299321 RepID=A0AAY4EHZ0_9TELE|nr:CASP8 and FADD-like apoptosis regulator [Denticeps clupeoides]